MTQPDLPPQSPQWWVSRLFKQLATEQPQMARMDAYYRGDHPLPWLPSQARDEFRRILSMTRSNYMGLVVDAMVERIQVEGFRVGEDAEADDDTWAIWQANNLDADSDSALLEAAINRRSCLLVTPTSGMPLVTVEHPTQAVVEYVPGSGRRIAAAALKLWLDDWTGQLNATLYLPDWIYKFTATAPRIGLTVLNPSWSERRVTGEDWPARNTLGEVPMFELANNPRMLTGGVSELADVTDVQDRINKTIADRLITQDFGAFPQKWALGWPEQDAEGNPTQRIDVGRNRMVTSDIPKDQGAFGQWDAAPLDPYSSAKREDVKDIASRTRTPAQYLLGEMSNVNGETLKASESGLVAKVRQRCRSYGETFEAAMRLARKAKGLPDAGAEGMETIWRNPEFRTEGELVDALTKMSSLRVPDEALWERWGATPQEIERWNKLNAERAMDPLMASLMREMPAAPSAPGG